MLTTHVLSYSHPVIDYFKFMPSGKRFRSYAGSKGLAESFYPSAVKIFYGHHNLELFVASSFDIYSLCFTVYNFLHLRFRSVLIYFICTSHTIFRCLFCLFSSLLCTLLRDLLMPNCLYCEVFVF